MNAGFFGKVPSHGDFVGRRLAPEMVQAWDDWLQQCLRSSKQQLGADWLNHYLSSPVWRFAAGAGVLDEHPWAGVMMPSVDRVGRHFPLMLATRADPATPSSDWIDKTRHWYDKLDELARSALGSEFALDQFDRALAALAPQPQPQPEACASARWRLPMPALGQTAPDISRYLLDRHSLWWSEGSPSVEPSLLVCPGMPDPDGFAAMLDGRWQACGWRVPASAGTAPAAP